VTGAGTAAAGGGTLAVQVARRGGRGNGTRIYPPAWPWRPGDPRLCLCLPSLVVVVRYS
jgi:hypothetical protein